MKQHYYTRHATDLMAELPVFFVFPVAFTLNRFGQHDDIDPSDAVQWNTLARGYGGLIYGWLVENRAPRTNWSAPRTSEAPPAVQPHTIAR